MRLSRFCCKSWIRWYDSVEVSSQFSCVFLFNQSILSCTSVSSCSSLMVILLELVSQESWVSPITVASLSSTSCLRVSSCSLNSFRLWSTKCWTKSACSWARSLLFDWNSLTVPWISSSWRCNWESKSWTRSSKLEMVVVASSFVSFR